MGGGVRSRIQLARNMVLSVFPPTHPQHKKYGARNILEQQYSVVQIERKHIDSHRHVGPLGAHLGAMLYLKHAKTNANEPCWALETDLEATWAPCLASWGQLGGHTACFVVDLGTMLDLTCASCWASWRRFWDHAGALWPGLGPC